MRRRNPPMVHGYTDRHGKARYYLRRPGVKKVPLPGLVWSPEFMAAYEAAKAGDSARAPLGAGRTVAGTINAALVSYYQSSAFNDGLAKSSQQMRRAILERFREEHGEKRVALMHRKAIQTILNSKTPAASRNWKKALRGFLNHCLSLALITVDPLAGVTMVRMKTTGHHPWQAEECAQFEAHHDFGSRARLAYELLLQAGQSRCDVVRMGRQHVRNGMMSMGRQKTGVSFNVGIMPSLQRAIDAVPATNHLSFLVTPASATGFANCAMRPACQSVAPRTGCGRRRRPISRRRGPPIISSWRGSAGVRSRRRRSIHRRRTVSSWRRVPRSSFREQELAHLTTRLAKRAAKHLKGNTGYE
jgi:hypothetical protein